MKTDAINVFNNKIFKVHDWRITGADRKYSPRLYYKFRQAVMEHGSGITANRKNFYVISPKQEGNAMFKALKELGIQFFNFNIKNKGTLKKAAKIISEENTLLRSIK